MIFSDKKVEISIISEFTAGMVNRAYDAERRSYARVLVDAEPMFVRFAKNDGFEEKGLLMLKIEQFCYGSDNLAYLVYAQKQALAVDGGAWEEILHFLENYHLELTFVVNTHNHFDHTSGNEILLKRRRQPFWHFLTCRITIPFLLEGERISVFRTPGHSTIPSAIIRDRR
jgi:glyoxylase-like metal-dependent hydrolase (beta-lactamase superfamily II)